MRGLFEGTSVEPEFRHETVAMTFDSPEAALALYEEKMGPIVMAKAALQPQRKWQALHDDLAAFFRDNSEHTDGQATTRAEYLTVTGGKPA